MTEEQRRNTRVQEARRLFLAACEDGLTNVVIPIEVLQSMLEVIDFCEDMVEKTRERLYTDMERLLRDWYSGR